MQDLAAVSVRTLIALNIVVIAFMDSFVMWNDSVGGKVFTYGLKFLNVFAFIFLLRKSRADKYMWAALAIPLVWPVWEETSLPASAQYLFSSTLPILTFLLLRDEEQVFVVRSYLKLIIFFLIPGFVIYLLINVISLPHLDHVRSLDKRNYENYFFLYYSLDKLHYRFFSIFDEPGVVGSLAAIVIFYYRKFLSRKEYIIYMIAGFLSFSLFFIVVFPVIYYFSNIRMITVRKRVIRIITAFIALILVYLAFNLVLNRFKDDPLIRFAVYNRFKWENGFIVGVESNRDTGMSGFDGAYRTLARKKSMAYWVGNGKAAAVKDFGTSGLSHRIMIYEKGVLIVIYALMLVVIMQPWRRQFIFSLISVGFVVALLFQRPLFFKVDYFILIFTGLTLASAYAKKEDSTYSS